MATQDASLSERQLDDDVFMSAADVKAYMAKVELVKMSKEMAVHDHADQARRELVKQMSQRIAFTPAQLHAFLGRVKLAAERGESELMIRRFPVELCTDHGRAINNSEADWPRPLPVGRSRPMRSWVTN